MRYFNRRNGSERVFRFQRAFNFFALEHSNVTFFGTNQMIAQGEYRLIVYILLQITVKKE